MYWPVPELMTLNVLANIFGLFVTTDYETDMILHTNFKIVEKTVASQSYEFSVVAMEAANAVAQNQYPDKFFFGVASSAYQVEGGYQAFDKGASVWDYWTHSNPELIADNSNGDVACNSYFRFRDDVQLVKNLGANMYKISLSWSRILPDGMDHRVSRAGIRYYNELINDMIANGITPMVTIHHFDIPHPLQLLGGWTNPKMADYFVNFANVVFSYFGDRVKYWITIEDPWELCNMQFGDSLRPIYNDTGIGNYLCGHHVLLAHAKAYQLYHDNYQWLQNGKIGISISTRWFEPEDYTSPEDAEAAEISHQFANYWFLNPLLGENGDYPVIMQFEINLKSALQHFKQSRLPTFSETEIEMIKKSFDFLGISFFTTYSAKSIKPEPEFSYTANDDNGIVFPESLESDMSARWLIYRDEYGAWDVKNTAENFNKLLRRLNDDYVLPPIYITANGYTDFGEIYDLDRAVYHYDHIKQLFYAMKAGVDVRGYIAWSLMDSFEWADGYSKRFGLYSVDFNDEARGRTDKLSTRVIKQIYESKEVPPMLVTAADSKELQR